VTTIQKTKAQPSWDGKKIQESAALIAASNVSTAIAEIAPHGSEAIKKYAEAWTTNGKLVGIKKAIAGSVSSVFRFHLLI
jgi:hypothetical protein